MAQITHEKESLKSELDRLRDRGTRWDDTERSWQTKNDRLDEENRQLRLEMSQLRETLDRLRDDEVQRAKELERAVTGYVRSVERSERRVVHDDKAKPHAQV